MKRPRHQWQALPRGPVDLILALKGPALEWREECAKCGTKKGRRRETTKARGRGMFSIVWRDVWRTKDGELVTKAPTCVIAEVSDV